jgi:hypothetical protein
MTSSPLPSKAALREIREVIRGGQALCAKRNTGTAVVMLTLEQLDALERVLCSHVDPVTR